MLRGDFRFHSGPHVYTVGERRVPGITSVIQAAGYSDGEWFTEEALVRGRAVHAATLQWDLTGELPSLCGEWQPFLSAYVSVRAALPCRWSMLEVPRLSRRMGYAGIPDRVGRVRATPAVVELKTGGSAEWHGMQLAAQDVLLGGVRGQRRRVAFYLREDATYRVVEYSDPRDYLRFFEALREHGEEAAAA